MSQFKYLRIDGPRAEDWKFVTTEFHADLHDVCAAPKEQLPFFQKEVGGFIEYVRLEGNLCAIVNEEGKLNNLTPTVAWLSHGRVMDILVGTVLVVRDDADGATLPVEESDLSVIKKHLRPVSL